MYSLSHHRKKNTQRHFLILRKMEEIQIFIEKMAVFFNEYKCTHGKLWRNKFVQGQILDPKTKCCLEISKQFLQKTGEK